MDKRARTIVLIAIALLIALTYGFLRYRQAVTNPATIRQTMASAERSSCISGSTTRLAGTATTPQQIDAYCECLTERTLNPMSDTEVVTEANRGANISEADRARIMAIAQTCNAQVFPRH